MNAKPHGDLVADDVRQILRYDATTGIFMWLVATGPRAKIGTVAGFKKKGYWSIQIHGRSYLAHRLAWLYVHGEWPDGELDHADNDKKNNAIANLRHASRRQNSCNQRKRRNNTSGYKGVSWHRPNRKWIAQICSNGKKKTIGYFADAKDASEAYAVAARDLHGEFWRAQ
jgi:hypothetical protein